MMFSFNIVSIIFSCTLYYTLAHYCFKLNLFLILYFMLRTPYRLLPVINVNSIYIKLYIMLHILYMLHVLYEASYMYVHISHFHLISILSVYVSSKVLLFKHIIICITHLSYAKLKSHLIW